MQSYQFYGEDEHTLDAKGRLAIPSRHRATLGTTVYIGRGMSGQVNLYPQPIFENMIQRIAPTGDDATGTGRAGRLIYSANPCDLDQQGRVVIPPSLRRYAALDGTVTVLGHRNHIEIWNPDRWQRACEEVVALHRESPDDYRAIARLVGEI